MQIASVILAAGQGTRMRSNLPKVLHPIAGRAMIHYSVELMQQVTGEKPVVVLGHDAERVQEALGDSAEIVYQNPQLGTGHAVQQAASRLSHKSDLVLITLGDMPLLSPDTIESLIELQKAGDSPIALVTVISDEPRGFGRIVRNHAGVIQGIVEEAHLAPEQMAIKELNASVYCFRSNWLWENISRIPKSPKGEYYLTDLIGLAVQDGIEVNGLRSTDMEEFIGVNTRVHLAEVETILRRRITEKWMLEGVTITDPDTTYIDSDVILGQDTSVLPNTQLQGSTSIGENCVIGPNSFIRDSRIGDQCKVFSSVIESAILEDHVEIGPYGHLRKGAHLAAGVHMGNFGEVKNSYLGPGTKMGHFSYLGDATLGDNVNVGAGTITCNYDGVQKHQSDIGKNVFIGSDTMLVAPVHIGENSRTGAGSVVTKDVPPDTVVVGVPARAIRKLKKDE